MKPDLKSCPTCGNEKLKYQGAGSTLVAYFSPDGHDHDDNCKIHKWKCPNGHTICARYVNKCPVENCGWSGKTECFCSPLGVWVVGEKVKTIYDPF